NKRQNKAVTSHSENPKEVQHLTEGKKTIFCPIWSCHSTCYHQMHCSDQP
ncbi:hypothetical protein KOW79_011016, partial [Hemibagrus wyckioides]